MKLYLFLLLFAFSNSLLAQKSKSSSYKKYPYWIEMIKDTNVNYFEAVKAYETFWKGKKKPLEEDDVIGQKKGVADSESNREKHEEIKERKREKEVYKKYGLECKKFEHWKLEVKPYVQPNGHILTRYEQLRLWKQH